MVALKQAMKLASTAEDAEVAKQEMVRRFKDHGDGRGKDLENVKFRPHQPRQARQEKDEETRYIPLPWHPAWQSFKPSKVLRKMEQGQWKQLYGQVLGEVPKLRVTWKNALPYSQGRFQSMNSRKLKKFYANRTNE